MASYCKAKADCTKTEWDRHLKKARDESRYRYRTDPEFRRKITASNLRWRKENSTWHLSYMRRWNKDRYWKNPKYWTKISADYIKKKKAEDPIAWAKRARKYGQEFYHSERGRKYYSWYRSLPHVRKSQRKSNRAWALRNPIATKAHNKVNAAVAGGKLKKGPCQKCGTRKKVEAHHSDYDKPFKIKWLCRPCHRRKHPPVRRS